MCFIRYLFLRIADVHAAFVLPTALNHCQRYYERTCQLLLAFCASGYSVTARLNSQFHSSDDTHSCHRMINSIFGCAYQFD